MHLARTQPDRIHDRNVLAANDEAMLRAAREEAEAAVRSRDDILAIVSHDLRNPLNTIAMSLSLLEMTHPQDGNDPQVGIMRRAIAQMNRLIQDLLDVNQIAAGGFVVRAQPVDVASLVQDVRAQATVLTGQKNQRLELPDAGDVRVLADRDRVAQVLSNLVGNAAKFTPEGGRIRLSTEVREREVRFCVSDTGPGIDQQDLPHIFDRFWQVRRVRRGGVGLGLAISKGIVEAHGGRIWARSIPGIGSEFHFTLPRAAGET